MAVYQINGHWYIDVTINKRRIRKAIKEARTRRQAEQAERILRDEIFESRFGVGGQKFFADFVENSYKPYAKAHKKGYDVEVSSLKPLIETFGNKRLYEITPEQIETFKRKRATEKTSRGTIRAKSTVNREIAVLSAVFGLAKNYGEIKENPVSRVKYYGNLKSRDRVLSDDEEKLLFESIKGDEKLSRQVKILLYTGLRRGELFKIEWRDVDLSEGFINLRAEITKANRARTIPMLSNVQEIFEALRREAGDVETKEKVFAGADNQNQTLSSKFREVCDELGFNDVALHTLRHTFSTRADKYKVGAFAQKELLGHSKLTMTDKYTHPSKETLKASLGGFEQHIRQIKDIKTKDKKENAPKAANLLDFKKKE